ncbi:sensor histidine kinase [Massilia sp. CCM 8733]|uniref:Sensor histidine kinase n=2 Tax=Massilia mucilaginosa TaxID=2609282 RepID=A0ABX0NV44_9BURK|nr:sensor histidine kinase [Massilia mucilaginosa]
MIILGMPAIGHGYAPAFRALYFAACLAWTVPLTLLQRALWRRGTSWMVMLPVLLVASYPMSVVNALLGQWLAVRLGVDTGMHLDKLLRGLDNCWLPLIAFCAIHAVAAYYLAYQRGELRLAQAMAAARDAELRALRYQVNPHFLFNTLNAISALVSSGANDDANRMLARVADFLRATLAHGDAHEHALADELALTEAYLDIEKVRLGERLRMTIKVGPGLLDAPVPYLLLQPLVENAIRHGIAPNTGAGRLDISVERDGALLRIAVRNDGVAPAAASSGGGIGPAGIGPARMGPARIGPARIGPARIGPARIGLANVGARLRQLYGDTHSVDAGWGADGRFQVRLALPLAPSMPSMPGLAA